MQKHNIGDEISLKILREGKAFDIKVNLEERR